MRGTRLHTSQTRIFGHLFSLIKQKFNSLVKQYFFNFMESTFRGYYKNITDYFLKMLQYALQRHSFPLPLHKGKGIQSQKYYKMSGILNFETGNKFV